MKKSTSKICQYYSRKKLFLWERIFNNYNELNKSPIIFKGISYIKYYYIALLLIGCIDQRWNIVIILSLFLIVGNHQDWSNPHNSTQSIKNPRNLLRRNLPSWSYEEEIRIFLMRKFFTFNSSNNFSFWRKQWHGQSGRIKV